MLHSLVRPLRPFLSTSRLITQHKHTFATFIVKCPPIAESINEADVGELTTQVGDWVAMDGAVCTLETDKVRQDYITYISQLAAGMCMASMIGTNHIYHSRSMSQYPQKKQDIYASGLLNQETKSSSSNQWQKSKLD